jgi:hypothetical protein
LKGPATTHRRAASSSHSNIRDRRHNR